VSFSAAASIKRYPDHDKNPVKDAQIPEKIYVKRVFTPFSGGFSLDQTPRIGECAAISGLVRDRNMLVGRHHHCGRISAFALTFFSLLLSFVEGKVSGRADAADDLPVLAVTYYDYPPNIMDVEGSPRGLFVSRLTRIAEKAGYRIAWQQSSIEEEVHMLNDGKRAFCTSGKLHTPDRARRWTFIPYVFGYASANLVVTRAPMFVRVAGHADMAALIKDPGLTGALVNGATYGEEIDRFLGREQPKWILSTGKSGRQLLIMVMLGRADYAVVQERQWQMALATIPDASKLHPVASLRDDRRPPIFLACSRTLEMSVIRSLADAMAALGFPYADLSFLPEPADRTAAPDTSAKP
jgi:uncharacterized protein (TIGR02285 family)